MNYSTDQVINGLISYADNEVMGKLPTSGKWLMGTAIGLATTKVNTLVNSLKDNTIVQMLGIIDENGLIDVEALLSAMKQSAERYGNIVVDVPMVGKLTFTSSDVDRLRTYIM